MRLGEAIASEQQRLEEKIAEPVQPGPQAALEEEPLLAEIIEPELDDSAGDTPSAVPSILSGDPASRVRQYADRRAEAASEEEVDSAEPPPRREALSKLLAAFMEEKNIRWGELVGGLLIVCCSIALVISFWAQIAERPLLKFVLFNGVTAALFGVGFYTERRWQLRTTSRGMLIICMLLVPLNILAIAAFTKAAPPTDVVSIGGEVVSLAVFSVLTLLAAKIVTPGTPLLVAVGVMVPSVMQLLVRRFIEPEASIVTLYGGAAIPIVCYLAVSGIHIATLRKAVQLDERAANQLLILLGLVTYATLIPLGLLLLKTEAIGQTLHDLSPFCTVLGVPALAAALLFWRRMSDRQLAGLRTAGISLGVLGAAVMAAAVVLAWPDPATLLPVAIVNAAVFTGVAIWFSIPAAHVLAAACVGIAWLLVFHLSRGSLTWNLSTYEPLINALLTATSGTALVPLAALFGVTVLFWIRLGRGEDAKFHAAVAAATAILSLVLVTIFGFGRAGDPHHVTWIYAFYAASAAASAVFIKRRAVGWATSLLMLAALVQGLVYRNADTLSLDYPWFFALLLHATLAAVGAVVVRRALRGEHTTLHNALCESALATSVAVGLLIAMAAPNASAGALYPYLFWLSGTWLALACLRSWPWLFTAFQAALAVSVCCALTAIVETRQWYTAARHPWLDPWFLQAQGIALAVFSLIWSGIRLALEKIRSRHEVEQEQSNSDRWLSMANRYLDPPWPTVDRCLATGVIALLVFIACYAAMPGVARELAPRVAVAGGPLRVVPPAANFELSGMIHEHAAGVGSWLLLVAALSMLIVRMRNDRAEQSCIGILLATAMACPLIAARWEASVSVASSLRWSLAAFFVAASAAIWLRDSLTQWLVRFRLLHGGNATAGQAARHVRFVLFFMMAAAYVAMAIYVCVAALQRAGVHSSVVPLVPSLAMLFVLAATAAIVLRSKSLTFVSGGDTQAAKPLSQWATHGSHVLLVLGVGPLLVALLFAVAMALMKFPIVGPEPKAWFRQIGWATSYALPVLVMAVTLVGHAIRERSSQYSFSAGLLFNLGATGAFMLALPHLGLSLDAVTWVNVAQINTIVTAGFSLCWLAALYWHARRWATATLLPAENRFAPQLLVTQIVLAIALCVLSIAPAAAWLVVEPFLPPAWIAAAGGELGWLGLALVAAGVAWVMRGTRVALTIDSVGWPLIGITIMAALTVARWDKGDWLAYHTLLSGCGLAAWLVLGADWAIHRVQSHAEKANGSTRWAVLLGTAAVLLALRAAVGDPDAPRWTVGVLIAMSTLAAWLAWREARRMYIYAAGLVLNLAASIWWIQSGYLLSSASGISSLVEFLRINILAATLPVVVWVIFELRRIGPAYDRENKTGILGFHRLATFASVGLLLLTIGVGLLADLGGGPLDASPVIGWAALAATAIAVLGCVLDPAARFPVASQYLLGLAAVGLLLDQLDMEGQMFGWAFTLMLAAFSLAASYLWSRRAGLRAMTDHLRAVVRIGLETSSAEPAPDEPADRGFTWIVTANAIVAVLVTMLALWLQLTMESFQLRLPAAQAIVAQAIAMGMLARGTVRSPLQNAALVLGVLFAVAFGWALLPLGIDAPLLHRTAVVTVALAIMIVLYGFGLVKLPRRWNEWTRAAQGLVPLLVLAATASILLVIGVEIAHYADARQVPIEWPALAAIAISLLGLCLAALAAAVLPGRDPLGLSERGRTAYVYAAEVMLALLCVHIRLTMPELFHGWFEKYWPLVAMGIAFVGVGLGEWLRRRRQAVLSEPLESTGALLPILPVLGFWVLPGDVNYSLLLLSVGVLYAALSVLRRSFLFGVLAALAANGSLWYLLYRIEGLGLAEHPQLWVIPLAVCVLVGAYINRKQLTPEQMTTIRYMSAIVIYASSTTDIFLNGVANEPWLPLVLAGFSLAGIFAGIMLRVRAFLYLGTSFLVVALFTIIWYAAVELERTWIWWVSGIITGILIIALFAVFEKKRDDVLRLVEHLKKWES